MTQDPGNLSPEEMYGRRPFDYGTQADGTLAGDDEIVPESADDDSMPAEISPAPVACAECGWDFANPTMRRRAKGFDVCVGCMIADGREHELSDDDQDALGERRAAGRIDQ